MALYKGLDKCLFCKGDKRPAALYLGDKQIAGAVPDTVSGNGRIEYTSPYKGPFKSVVLSGNAEQQRYEGYNMLDLSKAIFKFCVPQEDGTIVSNVDNSYYCYIAITELNDYLMANKGNAITFYLEANPNSRYNEIVIYGERSTTSNNYQAVKSSNVASLTIANDFDSITKLELRFNRDFNDAFTDTTTVFSNPMLLEGAYTAETLPEYEPYTGGKVIEKPYNIFKECEYIRDELYVITNTTFDNGDQVTIMFDAVVSMGEKIKITYGEVTGFEATAFEGETEGDGLATQHIYASFKMDIGVDDWLDNIGSSFKVYNATIDESSCKVYRGLNATEYIYRPSPAPSPTYPIQPAFAEPKIKSLGRNLIDGSRRITPKSYAGITCLYIDDEDCYLLNGTSTKSGPNYRMKLILFRGKGETIRIDTDVVSGNIDVPDGKRAAFYLASGDDNTATSFCKANIGQHIKKVLQNSYVNADWFWHDDGVTADNLKVKVMVYADKNKQPYERYFDGNTIQLPQLCSITDETDGTKYFDTFDTQSGKLTRRIAKIVLNGTEEWLSPLTTSIYGLDIFYLKLTSMAPTGTSPCYCTHFTYEGAWSNAYINKNAVKIHTVGDTSMIYIAQDAYSTLDDWKEFLTAQYDAGTPVTVWYVLDVPVVETVNVTPLEMSGGYGQVIQTDFGLTAPIEVKYYKEYTD